MRQSIWNLLSQGFRAHRDWPPMWRSPDPKAAYDAIIIGGGGHGLATAYYLARNHGIRNVAVLEKGWLGGGNTGRNTTAVRSNYLLPESLALYELSLRLYEGLSAELDFNIMLSQRGIVTLAHGRGDLDRQQHWFNTLRSNGVDSELLSVAQVARLVPALDVSAQARIPVVGAIIQRRGGTARHDAVAWGYARAADKLGVDIIQNCEVTGLSRSASGAVDGVHTSRGSIRSNRVAAVVAGHSSIIAAMAGFRLPIRSYSLQAYVSEPVKPVLDTVVISPSTGVYVSQSDKGDIVVGGALDRFQSYAQRGSLAVSNNVMAALVDQFPGFRRLRMLRQWAGTVDVTPDSSPILGASPVAGLYLNCGWGTGGFKAIPAGGWLLAHHLAQGRPHSIAIPFGLDRFSTGALIDEAAAAGIAH